jgi:ATP-dependent helicase/nuclease subunit A
MHDDSAERQQAIDPRLSFIVQAPAGSGKTELLTQRFLRLLATVQAPEHIIALTFTRKAANEMRQRIQHALQQAAVKTPARSPHQQQTLSYAAAVLTLDTTLGWNLLEQPSRLRILTIDSLCQRLTAAMPIQEQHIPFGQLCEKPHRYYAAAAQNCLHYLLENPQYHRALTLLLRHVDNRQDRLVSLFMDLLEKRDQWMQPLHHAKIQDKAWFEEGLTWIEAHVVSRLQRSLTLHDAEDLQKLCSEFAELTAHVDSLGSGLATWLHSENMNRSVASNLAALLLTSQNSLRKSFDHHIGLKRGVCKDTDYVRIKTASAELLAHLSENQEFLQALIRVRHLPPPTYDSLQWEILQALFLFLPLLTAHLQILFAADGMVDFTSVSQQALLALGDADEPTDLALFLDFKIQHLLIDEFQDTSIQQFELLSRLVSGWEKGDGKTLFVVGDPMQSIYRFRSAEVGLFLRAKQQGIGPVELIPLQLKCNFRSSPIIVDWVNQTFKTIFSSEDDIESGAVSFNPSIPTQASHIASGITAIQYADPTLEAEGILELVKKELVEFPEDKIAILVRSRKQLNYIIHLFRQQQIPFQGVEIDRLAHLPHLRDTWSLTQALLMPANRLAWLAFLRSPWCGLSLVDLHKIAQFDKKRSIFWALNHLDEIPELSAAGRSRAAFVYRILDNALASRHQHSLSQWILNTLRQLNLDFVLNSSEQNDLEQFWILLDNYADAGIIEDLESFKEELEKLYSQQTTPSRIQIMTIHKSKGLEFDCVILPGLSTKTAPQDSPLFRWLKLPTKHEDILLFSPMKGARDEFCPLYNYLGKIETEKADYEIQRLLYVAATRAKKRLYLIDNREKGQHGSFRSLLSHQAFTIFAENSYRQILNDTLPELKCLPLEFYPSLPASPFSANEIVFPLATQQARIIGIATHELLQWICTYHPNSFTQIPFELAEYKLKTLGLFQDSLHQAQQIVQQQIQQFWKNSIGQWIIQEHHEEHNELELLCTHNGEMVTRIIDRTFVSAGIRWIIDFKTGAQQNEHYTAQLNEYAKILWSQHSEPIRCGMYYLENGEWITWDYIPEPQLQAAEPLKNIKVTS